MEIVLLERSLSDCTVCPEGYRRRAAVLCVPDRNLFQVSSPGHLSQRSSSREGFVVLWAEKTCLVLESLPENSQGN